MYLHVYHNSKTQSDCNEIWVLMLIDIAIPVIYDNESKLVALNSNINFK